MPAPLAVVMPVVNGLKYTRGAVTSFACADESRWIVIDNDSTDGTRAYLDRRLPEPNLVLHQEHNLGVAAAWNLGLRTAFDRGIDRVIVTNNDLVFSTETANALVRWAERGHPFVTVTAVHVLDREQLNAYVPTRSLATTVDFCCFLIERSVIERVGWFDEEFWPAYWEDMDYLHRMLARGIRPVRALDALVLHYGSRSVRDGWVPLQPHFDRNKEHFDRKHGKPARLAVLALRSST